MSFTMFHVSREYPVRSHGGESEGYLQRGGTGSLFQVSTVIFFCVFDQILFT